MVSDPSGSTGVGVHSNAYSPKFQHCGGAGVPGLSPVAGSFNAAGGPVTAAKNSPEP